MLSIDNRDVKIRRSSNNLIVPIGTYFRQEHCNEYVHFMQEFGLESISSHVLIIQKLYCVERRILRKLQCVRKTLIYKKF